jgi:hypothetical protein
MGKFAKLAVCPVGRGVPRKTDDCEQSEGTEEMEGYHIDRFGSVDGIVLRTSEDPRPAEGDPDLMLIKSTGRDATQPGVGGPARS